MTPGRSLPVQASLLGSAQTTVADFVSSIIESNDPTSSPNRKRVLIFTASVGAGHEATGREIAAELMSAGHTVVINDGLHAMGRVTSYLMVDFYAWQLEHAPWLYDAIFRCTSTRPVSKGARWFTGKRHGQHVLDLVDDAQPDIVISTYPLVTAALGRLIHDGRVRQPVIATISDFGAHPMWMTPEADLHLVPAQCSADLVAREGGRVRVANFPINQRFRVKLDRTEARTQLHLPQDAVVPLIVGGAWGVGDLDGAAQCAVDAGACPVIVCGRNEAIRKRLQARFGDDPTVKIFGWTAEMPALMAAADCLVQNAGGVTCLEAMEVGLPIVIYRSLPGHGRMNARMMASSGAAVRVDTPDQFRALLARAATGDPAALPAPRRDPGCRATATILETKAAPRRPPVEHKPIPRPVAFTLALSFLFWMLFSTWPVALALDHVPVPVGSDTPSGSAAVVVRAYDPATARALEAYIAANDLPVALFVTNDSAKGLAPTTSITLGITEEPKNSRIPHPLRAWEEPRDTQSTINDLTGADPVYFLPRKGNPDTIDFALKPRSTVIVWPSNVDSNSVSQGVLLVETDELTPAQAVSALAAELSGVKAAGLTVVTLDAVT